jgi:hypothetical protein
MRVNIFFALLVFGCSTKNTQVVQKMPYYELNQNVVKELNYVKTTFFQDEDIEVIGQTGIKSRFFIYSYLSRKSFLYSLSDKKLKEIDFDVTNDNTFKNISLGVKKNLTSRKYISGYHDFILCEYKENGISNGFMFYGSYLNWQGNNLEIFKSITKKIGELK